MSPIPLHPVALVVTVVAFSALLAALCPFTSGTGYLKYFVICLVGLCALMLFGASIGKTLHDFLAEMNGTM